MTTYTFREVKRTVEKNLPCKVCDKPTRRTFTGSATYNPFNDGDPPSQALDHALAAATKGEAEGITCKWCEDAPQREALLAFADGQPLPERKWCNPTDILLDRENIKEVWNAGTCPTCNQPHWTLTGYEITDKGRRVIEKAHARHAAETGA